MQFYNTYRRQYYVNFFKIDAFITHNIKDFIVQQQFIGNPNIKANEIRLSHLPGVTSYLLVGRITHHGSQYSEHDIL